MNDAARKLASYGRHGDNMLMHVSRKELEGIRSLTGRNFTRNPDTGLPEAFGFADLIPAVAGIAGTVLTGNPLIGAAAAGATSAGKTAIEGGSAQDALISGLVSGATTFAGGQLLSGIGGAAGGAAAQGAGAAGAGAAGAGAADAAAQTALSAGTVGAGASGAPLSAAAGMNPMTMPFADAISMAQANAAATSPVTAGTIAGVNPMSLPNIDAISNAAAAAALPVPPPPGPGFGDLVASRASDFGARLSNVANDPGTALSQLGKNIQNNRFSALIAGGGMLSQAGNMFGQPSMPGEEEYDANRYPERFPSRPRSFTAPPAGYMPGRSPEFRYFAEGGLASLRQDEGYTANLVNEAKAALLGEHPRPREAIMRFQEAFGNDALNLLRDRISGGRVRGAGGGMDDLVPGSIEGRQKVRLADGEFVIPSDVVSGLGDGSTDQGVRKLHGLMDNVRQQRTGRKAQPMSIGGKITL
jgi:hypothetical protein